MNLTAVPIAALRVFKRAFVAQDIAEPFISFDSDRPTRDAAEAMTKARVELAGVRRNGVLRGLVEAANLGQGFCEAFRREFAPHQVVAAGIFHRRN